MEGRDLASEVRHFEYSIELLTRNFRELDAYLTHLTSPLVAVPLLGESQKWRLQAAMREVAFLLHNYVASAMSLVEHSRVLYRHLYEPESLFPEYSEEVKARFADDPLTQFVLKLRQMAQHYRLPSVALNAGFQAAGPAAAMQVTLLLQKDDLQRFSSWNVPATKYLDAAGATIDIQTLVRSYHTHVLEFYRWFRQQQDRIHGSTFALASRLQAALFESGLSAAFADLDTRAAGLEAADQREVTPSTVRQLLLPALTLQEERAWLTCKAISLRGCQVHLRSSMPANAWLTH